MSSINDKLDNLPFDDDNTLQDIEAEQRSESAPSVPLKGANSGSEGAFLAYAEDAHKGLSDDPLPMPKQSDAKADMPAAPKPEEVRKRQAIRTYQSDVAETMRGKQVSLADIAIAEQQKREKNATRVPQPERAPEPQPEPQPQRPGAVLPPQGMRPVQIVEVKKESHALGAIMTVIGGVLLLSVATGILLFVYGAWRANREPVQVVETTPDIGIVAESVARVQVTGTTGRADLLNSFKDAVDQTGGTTGDVVGIQYVAGTSTAMTGQDFLTRLGTSAEDRLIRTIEDDFIAGVHITNAEHSFVVFKTSLFENAFAGMLAWEETLVDDLSFARNTAIISDAALEISVPRTASSTATGSADVSVIVPQDPLFGAEFRDVVVANKNARALYTQRGEIVLVYSFPNTNTLVITSNIETLREIFDRLAATRFSR